MVVGEFIIAVAVTMISYIVGDAIYKFYVFYRKLNKIPGPGSMLSFSNEEANLPLEEKLDYSVNVSRCYKDGMYRTWIGTTGAVHISKPEHIEIILRSTSEITKSKIYNDLKPWLGQGLLLSTGSLWHHDRKVLNPAFHFAILGTYAEVMIEKSKIFVNRIDEEIKKHGDEPFDVFEMCMRCTLDVICETAMGMDIRAQEDVHNEYTKAVATITTVAVWRFLRPWLAWDWVFYRTEKGKSFKEAIEMTHAFCDEVIEKKTRERKSSSVKGNSLNFKEDDITGQSRKKAFLDLLLEENEKDEKPMTNEEIRDQVNTFLFAGHDTTGALIGWTLFSLGIRLDIQEKVYEELEQVLGNSEKENIMKQMSNLKYLERVIKEVLRLYPSVSTFSRKLTNDLQIGEHIVPSGSILALEVYQAQRNPTTWPDPLNFDPDRFLPENIKNRHPHAYIPFSAGLRNCIGQKFAMLETKLILSYILRAFTFKSIKNHTDIKKFNDIILRPADGIYLHMKRRKNNLPSLN